MGKDGRRETNFRRKDLELSRMACYQENPKEVTPGEILEGMIRRLFSETGRQVVVVVDEYDAPLLDVMHDEAMLDSYQPPYGDYDDDGSLALSEWLAIPYEAEGRRVVKVGVKFDKDTRIPESWVICR